METEEKLHKDVYALCDKMTDIFEEAIKKTDAPFYFQASVFDKNGPTFILGINDDILKDESHEFVLPFEQTKSVEDALGWMQNYFKDFADDYNVDEEKSYYTPGMGDTPPSPQFDEEFEIIEKDYHKAAELAHAVYQHEIRGDEKAYQDLKNNWLRDERNTEKEKIRESVDALQFLKTPPKEVLSDVMRDMQAAYRLEPKKMLEMMKEIVKSGAKASGR